MTKQAAGGTGTVNRTAGFTDEMEVMPGDGLKEQSVPLVCWALQTLLLESLQIRTISQLAEKSSFHISYWMGMRFSPVKKIFA